MEADSTWNVCLVLSYHQGHGICALQAICPMLEEDAVLCTTCTVLLLGRGVQRIASSSKFDPFFFFIIYKNFCFPLMKTLMVLFFASHVPSYQKDMGCKEQLHILGCLLTFCVHVQCESFICWMFNLIRCYILLLPHPPFSGSHLSSYPLTGKFFFLQMLTFFTNRVLTMSSFISLKQAPFPTCWTVRTAFKVWQILIWKVLFVCTSTGKICIFADPLFSALQEFFNWDAVLVLKNFCTYPLCLLRKLAMFNVREKSG